MARTSLRGQTLLLMALTLLLVTLMVCMSLAITSRIRKKLELQTAADAAAYSNAVATARGFNSIGLVNRTVVSHWVAMLGVHANHAWASTVPAYFEAFADAFNDMRFRGACGGPNHPLERQRQRELLQAREYFLHASFSLWNRAGPKESVALAQCNSVPGTCIRRLSTGMGQLDVDVAKQTKKIWTTIQDLTELQQDLHDELQGTLEGQLLTRRIAAMAEGREPSANPWPVRVEQGSGGGIDTRPAGWREVSGALGTDVEAILPIAHAVMGSRGSRFVVSGAKHYPQFAGTPDEFATVLPRRAKLYTSRIQKLLNARYGGPGRPRPFSMGVSHGLMTSYVDQGGNTEMTGNVDDIDELVTEIEDMVEGDEDAVEEAPEGDSAESPRPQYNANRAQRIGPNRSIGWQNATARSQGKVRLTYWRPCGGDQEAKVPLMAASRSFTDLTTGTPISQHEWMLAAKRWKYEVTQGVNNVGFIPEKIHGRYAGPGNHGYELANHDPSMKCHPNHRHWGEQEDELHRVGPEIREMGIAPGGFGFVFPQTLAGSLERDGAYGAFGQPKLPVLLTRAHSGPGITRDPWDLTVNFRFSSTGAGTELDLAKEDETTPAAVLSNGIAYYHRRCPEHQRRNSYARSDARARQNCVSWAEPPNMLNPFWRATLVPIDIDEGTATTQGREDRTPGKRRLNEAARMLETSGLDDAAEVYRLLVDNGYQGIQ